MINTTVCKNGVRVANLEIGQTYVTSVGLGFRLKITVLRVRPWDAGGYCWQSPDPADIGQTIEVSRLVKHATWTRVPNLAHRVPQDYTPTWSK